MVGSIEYNYERDGIVVVAAGTKVLGDVQQASPQGYLSVHFHTLQMPDGREEKIEGTGIGLDQKPLKGEVIPARETRSCEWDGCEVYGE